MATNQPEEQRSPPQKLRTGFTTGACATAAAAAAAVAIVNGERVGQITIRLPRGQTPTFMLENVEDGPGWARASVRKDAGDDPDVTHNVLVVVTLREAPTGSGVLFRAGEGVGMVTKPGLPLEVGEPAINPVPRKMISEAVRTICEDSSRPCDFEVEVAIPGGKEIALQTWNPRLGIEGGLSILGTTGIVKPYSCSAWIASLHRGIDVARATGIRHVAGSTGSTSEAAVQRLYQLPDSALLDMGDFVGGLLKYLRRHPIPLITIAGGFAKMAKLAQGATDLHSSRSQVDFARLSELARQHCDSLGPDAIEAITTANTAKQALDIAGPALACAVAGNARNVAANLLRGAPVDVEVMVFDRTGQLAARSSDAPFPGIGGTG